MKLPLNARVFWISPIDKIPVSPRAAVVSPAWNGRVVSEDCVQRYIRDVVVMEVSRPPIDLLLTGRVPRHLTAERIGLALPQIRAFAHHCFQLRSLIPPSFLLQIIEKSEKH